MAAEEFHDPSVTNVEGHSYVSMRFWRRRVAEAVSFPETLFEVVHHVVPGDKKAEEIRLFGASDEVADEVQRGIAEADEDDTLTTDRSIIEVVTPFFLDDNESEAEAVDRCLHTCVKYVTEFSRLYRTALRLRMRPITLEQLDPMICWIRRTLAMPALWEPQLHVIMLPPPDLVAHRAELSDADADRFRIMVRLWVDGHPMIPYSERTLEARTAFDRDGDYASTVLQAQTAVEVGLDAILGLLLWEEQIAPKDAAEVLEDSLHKRVRSQLPPP